MHARRHALAAAIPNFLILEQMEEECDLGDSLCTMQVRYADGYFELATGPGLGTDLRLDLIPARGFSPQPPAHTSKSLWQ